MIEHFIIGLFVGGVIYHHYLIVVTEISKRIKTKKVRTRIHRNNRNKVRIYTNSN